MTSEQKLALASNKVLIGDDVNRATFYYIREAIMQKMHEGSPKLVIYMSSNGGEVTAGLDICDLLQFYPGKKVAVVHALAASVAAVILQVCDWRTATPHSRILIHHVSGRNITLDTIRDEERMKKFVEAMEIDQSKLYSILTGRTRKSLEEIRETCKQDRSMPAKEALEYGLLDQIIATEAEIQYSDNAEAK